MKKRGFTIIELLIVVALIGILVGIGGVSIKKQAESKAMLRVQNEIGDFFRVAAKRSQETGKKYTVEFKLDQNLIKISRPDFSEELKLPNIFEYSIIPALTTGPTLTTTGNISDNFTLYISNSKEIKHAINFNKDDSHIKYLHIREYSPTNNSIPISEMTATPSAISGFKLIRD